MAAGKRNRYVERGNGGRVSDEDDDKGREKKRGGGRCVDDAITRFMINSQAAAGISIYSYKCPGGAGRRGDDD